jgi:sulfur relay (sulfurtransferase) complex TusBCD TusD component (DsrE family)
MDPPMTRKLLILLCDSPFQNESVDHAIELTKAALGKGHGASVFLMMDGVYNPHTSQNGEPFNMSSVSDRLAELVQLGVEISACRVCTELRGIGEENLPKGVDIGGIFDLSEALAESDVVFSLIGRR